MTTSKGITGLMTPQGRGAQNLQDYLIKYTFCNLGNPYKSINCSIPDIQNGSNKNGNCKKCVYSLYGTGSLFMVHQNRNMDNKNFRSLLISSYLMDSLVPNFNTILIEVFCRKFRNKFGVRLLLFATVAFVRKFLLQPSTCPCTPSGSRFRCFT